MSKRRPKHKTVPGQYFPFAVSILTNLSFASLSSHAIKLYIDLLASYNGLNNGDLSCAWKLMQIRGWKSRDTLNKAKNELLSKKFLMMTRQGGKNKCSLFALTAFCIDDCNGKMDAGFKATTSPPYGWDMGNGILIRSTPAVSKLKK